MDLALDADALAGAIVAAIGLVYGLFGYRLLKVAVTVAGVVVGGWALAWVAAELGAGEATSWAAGAMGALLGALLFFKLLVVGIFALGAGLGGLLAVLVAAGAGEALSPPVMALFGLVGGVVALVFRKHVLILATSFHGAYVTVVGLAFVLGVQDGLVLDGNGVRQPALDAWGLQVGAWLVLGLAGARFQYRAARPRSRDE